MFWTTVIYSLLSFPFVFFSLPILKKILTHAEPTGFAPNGECVPICPPDFPDEEEGNDNIIELDHDKDMKERNIEEEGLEMKSQEDMV